MSTIDVRDGNAVDVIQYATGMQLEAVGADIVLKNTVTGESMTVGNSTDMNAFARGAQMAKRVWG